MAVQSFRDLIVWQKSICLAKVVYLYTSSFPRHERYGLASQIQRSAVSIASNIAEGAQRNSRSEFKQFCGIAYASAAELETQLIISKQVYACEQKEIIDLLHEIQRMLRQLIFRLGPNR